MSGFQKAEKRRHVDMARLKQEISDLQDKIDSHQDDQAEERLLLEEIVGDAVADRIALIAYRNKANPKFGR